MAKINGKEVLLNANVETSGNGVLGQQDTYFANGADYAEVATWEDGNPNSENRLHRFVTLKTAGRKIAIADSNDQIVGVTSSGAAFVGNAKDYDKTDTSKAIVGIIGVVQVKTSDYSIGPNDRVMSDDNGYAVKSSNNLGYRVIAVLKPGTLEIVVSPNTDMIQRIKTDMVTLQEKFENHIEKHPGGGVSAEMANSLWAIIKKGAFAEALTDEEKSAFRDAWGIEEEAPEVIDTSPKILAENVSWSPSYTQQTLNGSCVTDFYPFSVDVDGLKAIGGWSETNNGPAYTGLLYVVKYCTPNSAGISFSSYGKAVILDSDGSSYTYASTIKDQTEHAFQSDRYKPYPHKNYKLSFSIPSADVDDSYAYWGESKNGSALGVMPIGVNAGDIIFAGKNTKYYGMRNISEYKGE